MEFSEKVFANRVAMVCHTIVACAMVLAYGVEWIKGARTLGYAMIVFVVMVGSVVAEWMVFHRDPENVWIRHIMAITYSSFYLFAIFTTNSLLAFVYAIPMYVAITIYSDVRYGAIISIGGWLCNVAYVAYYAITVGYTSEEIPDVEIQIICMALIGLFMFLTTRANKKIGDERTKVFQKQQDKTQELLEQVLSASGSMTGDISTMTDKVEQLGDSVTRIRSAMGEVSKGSSETADSIQTQMYQTEQIQNHISTVKGSAELIGQNVTETVRVVEESRHQMDTLAQQAIKATEASGQVSTKMDELSEYTKQMNTIIETITSIANSTGMLALNASIEAARAGEAGRGFAVVAGEISALANQTKNATVDITSLIENINGELVHVVEAVDVVSQNAKENVESTKRVEETFGEIEQGADRIHVQVTELGETMKQLEAANSEIVEKIQTVSAITEEVSAHSNETYDDCGKNSEMVEEISGIVNRLNEQAMVLQSMQ